MARTETAGVEERTERRHERTAICGNCGGTFKPSAKGQRFCDDDCERGSALHIPTRPGVPLGSAALG
jgi:hypothetical protein